jgi:Multimeric flavodoxin WrbA
VKKAIGINASPRKNWNTAQAVHKALEGAASTGAETRMVHLFDLDFKGCASCFACKRHENNAAICVIKDDLRPLLEEIMSSDILILGSPVYFGDLTASLRALMERLLFMNYTYDAAAPSKFKGSITTGLICTMNVPDAAMDQWGYTVVFERAVRSLSMVLNGPAEWLAVTDTLQFSDYSKYMSSMFDPEHKARMRKEKFPVDLDAAFRYGIKLAAGKLS